MFPWCVQVVAWVRISFLLLPYSILLYGYATFHLSIQIWIASFCGKSLFALMFLFLLSGNLGLELLGHTADLGLTFRKLLTCFPKGRHHFALSNLIWQMRTSKLWEAMSPAKDLIGFSHRFLVSDLGLKHPSDVSEACAFNCQVDPAPPALDERATHLWFWSISWGLKALLILPAS